MLWERSALGAGAPARGLLPALRRARAAERGRHRHRRIETGKVLPGRETATGEETKKCSNRTLPRESKEGRTAGKSRRFSGPVGCKGAKAPMAAKVLVRHPSSFAGIKEPTESGGIPRSEAKAVVECRRLVPPAGGRLLQGSSAKRTSQGWERATGTAVGTEKGLPAAPQPGLLWTGTRRCLTLDTPQHQPRRTQRIQLALGSVGTAGLQSSTGAIPSADLPELPRAPRVCPAHPKSLPFQPEASSQQQP
ncbi:uncharacterized protein LOC113941297 [Corapipo altera]|uniref:uncharacterized protein LOC113941297 n=1 Tax=Corapipo altera TaxID=415028 RepID=UPI000FD66351|nr:uncharacterized protein LOC113941297 [Corapipo altera]